MRKFVILRIGEGKFDTGFPLILRIGQIQANQLSLETEGRLPPAPKLVATFNRWQGSYKSLASRWRLGAPSGQVTNVSVSQCRNFADDLKNEINNWLNSGYKNFQKIIYDLLQNLNKEDEIQFIIQTDNLQLWHLPWHLWDFFDRYPLAEIGLSKLSFYTPIISDNTKANLAINILAILGDNTGINVEEDKKYLQKIKKANVLFLDQPTRKKLAPLWEKKWQILYFAGHSYTENQTETGILFINPQETLNIKQLKNTLKKAISNGLKIAIFNSCDGLGIANDLAELNIPIIIVMREPVPDLVAQEFLKEFLTLYSQGENLYNSVRIAKAKLQELSELENIAPGVTWLPVIYQNLAIFPPSWQDLLTAKLTKSTLIIEAENKKSSPETTTKREEKNPDLTSEKLRKIIKITLFLILGGLLLSSFFLLKKNGLAKPIREPYTGTCECPYDLDKNGNSCGNKSAYHRPGGSQPICFTNDKK